MFLDDMLETKSGTTTPHRSGSVGNCRTTLKSEGDGAEGKGEAPPTTPVTTSSTATRPSVDGSLAASSLTSSVDSVGGGEATTYPRPGSHTIEFFEMCANLIKLLVR